MPADILSLHSEGHVFPSADGFRYGQVTGIKKVKPSIRTVFFFLRVADIIQFLPAAAVVIKGRDELKVTVVCRFQNREQMVEAVDALF